MEVMDAPRGRHPGAVFLGRCNEELPCPPVPMGCVLGPETVAPFEELVTPTALCVVCLPTASLTEWVVPSVPADCCCCALDSQGDLRVVGLGPGFLGRSRSSSQHRPEHHTNQSPRYLLLRST